MPTKASIVTRSQTSSTIASDNLGTFEVHIEGFTEKGNPISVKTYFEVK